MITFVYSSSYSPPAPIITIVLLDEEGQESEPLEAFVDSGADATIVPRDILLNLNVTPLRGGYVSSQWGDRRRIDLYDVDIRISNFILYAIEVIADPNSNEIIVGRDVLNQLELTLNGPAQVVEIHP